MVALKKLLCLSLVGCVTVSQAIAEAVHVAVAANFAAAMQPVVEAFEAETGNDVILSFGSSGKLLAQIRNGAPFDVFLSADQAKPQRLEAAGDAVAASRFTYAIGGLALWSSLPDFVSHDYSRLTSGDYNKLALANPRLAPYGAAAMEVLEALDLTDATKDNWVQGENIAQTYQFVATGNADLGFVALSQVMDHGTVSKGSGWIVPSELYSPIRQDAVLLKHGANNGAAKALMSYLQGDTALQIIHSYGYKTQSHITYKTKP